MNAFRLKKKLDSVRKPDIKPDFSSIENYLHYRNLMDKFWLKKDYLFIQIYGDKFWSYKFGSILNKSEGKTNGLLCS